MSSSEKKFESLVQAFLIDMAMVECSEKEYIANLRYAISELEDAISAAEEMIDDPEVEG